MVGVILFDIVCTKTHEGKFVSGLIVYVLSVLSVIVPIVLYFMNSNKTGIIPEFFNVFITESNVVLYEFGTGFAPII